MISAVRHTPKTGFIVWRVGTSFPPSRIHATHADAAHEAARLARKHPGVVFHIYERHGSYKAECDATPTAPAPCDEFGRGLTLGVTFGWHAAIERLKNLTGTPADCVP